MIKCQDILIILCEVWRKIGTMHWCMRNLILLMQFYSEQLLKSKWRNWQSKAKRLGNWASSCFIHKSLTVSLVSSYHNNCLYQLSGFCGRLVSYICHKEDTKTLLPWQTINKFSNDVCLPETKWANSKMNESSTGQKKPIKHSKYTCTFLPIKFII